eukprot:1689778-Ditylum_brightwellii.AAC.1
MSRARAKTQNEGPCRRKQTGLGGKTIEDYFKKNSSPHPLGCGGNDERGKIPKPLTPPSPLTPQ